MRRSRAAVVAAAVLALVASPTVASAGGEGHGDHDGEDRTETVAGGLDGPRQVNEYTHDRLVVAESDSGEVSSVDPWTGEVHTLLSGLPSPQGVDYIHGKLYVALGEPAPDDPSAEAPSAGATSADGPRGSTVIVAKPDGRILHTYDLLAYELANNPDGQQQFDADGVPLDALSNPFAVDVQGDDLLVADAGANAVLSIDRESGTISTFFVPPRVSPADVPECEGANDAQGVEGCDPVPTGVTKGRDGLVYVSTLGAEVPGAARVYALTTKGEVVRVIEDLSGVTGIDVDHRGNVYVSELFAGLAGPPPDTEAGAAVIGRIVRIEPDGDRSYLQVTLPTGLEFADGELYASAWSVAGFVGLPGRGEVVRVDTHAFTEEE